MGWLALGHYANQPGGGPSSRSLLRDYEPSCGPSFAALVGTHGGVSVWLGHLRAPLLLDTLGPGGGVRGAGAGRVRHVALQLVHGAPRPVLQQHVRTRAPAQPSSWSSVTEGSLPNHPPVLSVSI